MACDILHFDWKDYLCTVDYFSSYFEVDCLKQKTGSELIDKLKRHCCTHGIPNQFYSDNGPPYNSHEFQAFFNSYNIEQHRTTSNNIEHVENAVKTIKGLLKKSKAAGSDFHMTLLDWRNIPSEGQDSSPAQRLFGRRTRTLLPTASELLKPKIVHYVPVKLYERK